MTKEEIIEGNDLIRELEDNFERFPLPICFYPKEEQRELYGRHLHIQEVVRRYLKFKKHINNHEGKA